jgi:hypothetical protein
MGTCSSGKAFAKKVEGLSSNSSASQGIGRQRLRGSRFEATLYKKFMKPTAKITTVEHLLCKFPCSVS